MIGEIDPFIINLTVFVLAIFVGYHVVWNVTPALHTPLMSVTNAISGIILVGAMLAAGLHLADRVCAVHRVVPVERRYLPHRQVQDGLGTLAGHHRSDSVFGGFLVSQRMLEMFKKKEKKGNA